MVYYFYSIKQRNATRMCSPPTASSARGRATRLSFPFHEENPRVLSIRNPQLYCFGCNAGGDSSTAARADNRSFRGALSASATGGADAIYPPRG